MEALAELPSGVVAALDLVERFDDCLVHGFARLGDAQRRSWAVPSWRGDLTREIDCVEEVARLRGYDTIPIVVPKAGVGETAAIGAEERITRAARVALAARGLGRRIVAGVVRLGFAESRGVQPETFLNRLRIHQCIRYGSVRIQRCIELL